MTERRQYIPRRTRTRCSNGGPLNPKEARLEAAVSSRYRLVRELGSGGMATVYLAEDIRHQRKVAVKVLRPELAAMGPERFLKEIQIAAGLQHPHILPLHESGEADGFLFYVMPYVDGQTLRDRLVREGELPVADREKIQAGIESVRSALQQITRKR